MFGYESTGARSGGGGGGGQGELGSLHLMAVQGHVRVIRFNSISSINDILGDNRYSIFPSS